MVGSDKVCCKTSMDYWLYMVGGRDIGNRPTFSLAQTLHVDPTTIQSNGAWSILTWDWVSIQCACIGVHSKVWATGSTENVSVLRCRAAERELSCMWKWGRGRGKWWMKFISYHYYYTCIAKLFSKVIHWVHTIRCPSCNHNHWYRSWLLSI